MPAKPAQKTRNKVALILAGALLLTWVWYVPKIVGPHESDGHDSHHHTENCAISTETNECYRESYAEITREHGVKAAFRQLRLDYDANAAVRSDCHQIVHAIGRAAAEKYDSISDAYGEGDEFCWSGYYHGVMEAIVADIDENELAAGINEICLKIRNEKLYSFYHYNCVHGLGHGAMLVEGHDLFASLRLCDNLDDSWERTSCWGGVFMENVISDQNDQHSTKYLRDDEPLYPCTAVEDIYKNECYNMQTSRALDVLGGDFRAVFELCATVGDYKLTCYQSLGRDASGRSVSDAAQTKATCELGQNYEAVSNCVIGAVKDFVSYYHSDAQAAAFCDSLESDELIELCLTTTKGYFAIFR